MDLLSALEADFEWMRKLVQERVAYFVQHKERGWEDESGLPDVPQHEEGSADFWPTFLRTQGVSDTERLILLMAMAPHLKVSSFSFLQLSGSNLSGEQLLEMGGSTLNGSNVIFPTLQTVVFVLGCSFIEGLRTVQQLFDAQHFFHTENLLYLNSYSADAPFLESSLHIQPDFLDQILTGQPRFPRFGPDFPARRLTTEMEWEDLVLERSVLNEIDQLQAWLRYENVLREDYGLAKRIKAGYRAMFYGPPGTGKSLTAAMLGKLTNLPVFRVDLSLITSKYVGETEKNLARIFAAAEKKNWILFFDEADAVFGKRTKVSDSHDRYANQTVSYLLQRIEDYAGLIILATNLRANFDEAFYRRFQSVIHFKLPDVNARLQLWNQCFDTPLEFDEDVNLRQIAANYELSGGSISNIVIACHLNVLREGRKSLRQRDIVLGIQREFQKKGRSL